MPIFRLAWRNLWRNSRRSAVTLAAVGLTSAILIATYSLMDGLMVHTIENVTNQVMGEAQIHAPKYLATRSMYKNLPDPEKILAELNKKGMDASARSYGYGLMAKDVKSSGAMFWGIDPKVERTVFTLANHIAKGRFLKDEPEMGVVLGKKLAKSLQADVGSEVVVVVQAADGSLGNELYTVVGILKTAGENVDRTAAIMHRTDFDQLFVSDGRVHEIAINTGGKFTLDEIAATAEAAAPDQEVKTWRQLAQALSDMLNMFDAGMAIFGSVFFLAGGLGVMNTMLMATFERIREFGILKAIGTSPFRIVKDVAAEALVMGLVATAVGAVIGLLASWYFQVYGLDTSSFAGNYTVSGVAFDPVWHSVISVKTVVYPVVIMWVVCILASLYPAVIAARLDPVKAMNHV